MSQLTRLKHELLWAVPFVACIFFAARVAWVNQDQAQLNVIAWLVAAVIAVFALIMERMGPPQNPRVGRISVGVSILATIAIISQIVAWPKPWNRDSPEEYFPDTIRVGMSADIQAWSTNLDSTSFGGTNPNMRGFEDELANYIATYFHKGWSTRQVLPALRAKTLDDDGVDIVISTYSITLPRTYTTAAEPGVDFTTPYYVDTAGVWANLNKVHRMPNGEWIWVDKSKEKTGKKPEACETRSTTGQTALDDFMSDNPDSVDPAAQIRDKAGQCLEDTFLRPDSDVAFVATDWSVLKAYDPMVDVDTDARHQVSGGGITSAIGDATGAPVDEPGPGRPEQLQFYGVAVRDNHPNTCKEVSKAVDAFVEQVAESRAGFGFAYRNNLQSKLGRLKANWHNPINSNEEIGRRGIGQLTCR